jgi:hypothetical protein
MKKLLLSGIALLAATSTLAVNRSFAESMEDQEVYSIVASVLAYEKVCGNGTLDPTIRQNLSKPLRLIPQVSEAELKHHADYWYGAIKATGCARAELLLRDRISIFK